MSISRARDALSLFRLLAMKRDDDDDDVALLYDDVVPTKGGAGGGVDVTADDAPEANIVGELALSVEVERLRRETRSRGEENERLKLEVERLRRENENLVANMSSLYDTAKMEIKRKEDMLWEEREKWWKQRETIPPPKPPPS